MKIIDNSKYWKSGDLLCTRNARRFAIFSHSVSKNLFVCQMGIDCRGRYFEILEKEKFHKALRKEEIKKFSRFIDLEILNWFNAYLKHSLKTK